MTFTNPNAAQQPTLENVNGSADDAENNDSDIDATGSTDVITLSSGESETDIDAGYTETATLGDLAFLDVDGDGIFTPGTDTGLPGITVSLTDAAGNPVVDASGATVADQTTDGNGAYLFTNLLPGDYVVTFTNPNAAQQPTLENVNGSADDAENNDSDADPTTGSTDVITLSSGENERDIDAGYIETATLGDLAFLDVDGDGIFTPGTDQGLLGVTVSLTDAAGNPVVDASGATVADQTTDGNGAYLFTNLLPGDYVVTFTNPNATQQPTLENVNGSADDAENNDSDADPTTGSTGVITLSSGENERDIDAGYIETASIGDLAFLDVDGDGIFTPGTDQGLPGVTVSLTDAAGNPVVDASGATVADQTTDGNGAYLFTNLLPGDYVVTFTNPNAAQQPTLENVNGSADDAENNDSDADPTTGSTGVITLSSGENERDIDAGYIETATLGDLAFLDVDGDGIFTPGTDQGLPGITVSLTDAAGNPVADASGVTIADQTTDGTGAYLFTNLLPGDYIVTFTNPNAAQQPTLENVNGSADDAENNDSDIDATGSTDVITLSSGENETDIDAGYTETATLGDLAFLDVNGDGIFTPGTDQGLPGITVSLTDAAGNPVADASGVTIADQTTDGTGAYLFTNLLPGDYIVTFTNPNAAQQPTLENVNGSADDAENNDSDIDATGSTDVITLSSGENETDIDAGYTETATLGDLAFLDVNGDGIFTPGTDTGLPGITVSLTDAAGNPVADASGVTIADQTTDGNGAYLFTNLVPGDYIVTFTNPNAAQQPTLENVNGSADDAENNDSDADPTTGSTGVITLSSGENETDIDAGYIETATLGDLAFLDVNGDGIFTPGTDTGLPGITVSLTDAAGNPVADASGVTVVDQTTDGNGAYLFTNLVPGDYIVTFTNPNSAQPATIENVNGSADDEENNDSDINPSGATSVVTLSSGENELDIDAGYLTEPNLDLAKTFVGATVQADGSYDVDLHDRRDQHRRCPGHLRINGHALVR